VYSNLRGRAVPVEDMAHGNMQPHYRGASAPGSSPIPNVLSKLNGSLDTSTHIPKREQPAAQPVVRRKTPRQREETDFQQGRYSDGSPGDGGRAPVPADSRGARTQTRAIRRRPLAATNSTVSRPLQPTVDQLRTGFNSSCSRASDSAHSLQVVSLEGLRRLSS
jgi:hypothetical protein